VSVRTWPVQDWGIISAKGFGRAAEPVVVECAPDLYRAANDVTANKVAGLAIPSRGEFGPARWL